MTTTTVIRTKSGRTRALPAHVDPAEVLGLDVEGRIVVQQDWMRGSDAYAFGLTLCCDAWDKGCEDGVYCRACYGAKPPHDAGDYLFQCSDGTYPGLDPVV